MRQKILCDKYNVGFNPSKFTLPFLNRKFYSYEIEGLIKKIDKLPIFRTDRHIIPQFNFIKHYLNHPNFEILHTSEISNKLLDIGIKEASFPNKEIALQTNKESFNKNNLNKEFIKILKNYYKEDYDILKKLKNNN